MVTVVSCKLIHACVFVSTIVSGQAAELRVGDAAQTTSVSQE